MKINTITHLYSEYNLQYELIFPKERLILYFANLAWIPQLLISLVASFHVNAAHSTKSCTCATPDSAASFGSGMNYRPFGAELFHFQSTRQSHPFLSSISAEAADSNAFFSSLCDTSLYSSLRFLFQFPSEIYRIVFVSVSLLYA